MLSMLSRRKDFEEAICWLIVYRIAYKVSRVSAIRVILVPNEQLSFFRLFGLGVSLQRALAGLNAFAILETSMFVEFKGARIELYVEQHLEVFFGICLYYWSNENATAEVDFEAGVVSLLHKHLCHNVE